MPMVVCGGLVCVSCLSYARSVSPSLRTREKREVECLYLMEDRGPWGLFVLLFYSGRPGDFIFLSGYYPKGQAVSLEGYGQYAIHLELKICYSLRVKKRSKIYSYTVL